MKFNKSTGVVVFENLVDSDGTEFDSAENLIANIPPAEVAVAKNAKGTVRYRDLEAVHSRAVRHGEKLKAMFRAG